MSQVPPGGGKETGGGVKNHRQGQQQTDPAHEAAHIFVHTAVVTGVHGDRQHHHLHRPQTGDREAPQCGRLFLLVQRLLAAWIERVCDIADLADRLEDVGQVDLAVIPAHARTMGAVVDRKIEHPGQGVDMAFVQPYAGGAGDALQDQRGGLGRQPVVLHEAALQRRLIVEFETLQRLGDHVLRFARRGLAVFIERGEATVDDCLGNRLAAMATHWALLTMDRDRIMGAVGHRQATVKTMCRSRHSGQPESR